MPSLSLQTHLVSSRPQLSPIGVDPKGFKSSLRSLIQFLIAKEVRATLWLKLPKDDAWWTDVWEYGQQAAGSTLYALGDQTGNPPENLAASLRVLPIKQDSDLKREYLCVAVASDFMCVLLAARTPPGEPTPDKRTLKLYCSTAGPAMTAMSVGLKRVIEHSLIIENESDEDDLNGTNLDESASSQGRSNGVKLDAGEESISKHAALSQWDRCFPTAILNAPSLPLTDAFISWQMQQQQDLRSQLNRHRSESKADPANSLSADFLNLAGQQLQSPLTTIKTALTLLGAPTLRLDQRQRYLDMISTQCAQQKALIDSVMTLISIQSNPEIGAQPIKLADMIPGVVSTYQPIAEESGIMLAYTVPPNLTEVMGVESDLKEVIIQLIQNGIQVTPHSGRVWVTATPQNDGLTAITVQDSGPGVSKSDEVKLFDAFYRNATPGSEAGSGLGLTLAKQLIDRMGGSISVESVLGRGTAFKILLPINKAAASVVVAPAATETQPAGGQLNDQAAPQATTVNAGYATASAGAMDRPEGA